MTKPLGVSQVEDFEFEAQIVACSVSLSSLNGEINQ